MVKKIVRVSTFKMWNVKLNDLILKFSLIQRLKMPEETIKTGTLGNWEWASEASDEHSIE